MDKVDRETKKSTNRASGRPGYCKCGCGRPTRKMRDGTYFSYRPGHHPLARERDGYVAPITRPTPITRPIRQDSLRESRLIRESWRETERIRADSTNYYDLLHNKPNKHNLVEPAGINGAKEDEEEILILKEMVDASPKEPDSPNEILLARYIDLVSQYNILGIKVGKARNAIEFTLRYVKRIWGTDMEAASVLLDRLNLMVKYPNQLSTNAEEPSVVIAAVDETEIHLSDTYTDPVNEKLQELYLQLLDKHNMLKMEHEKLRISIEFSIHFIQTIWSADIDETRVLVDRLRQSI